MDVKSEVKFGEKKYYQIVFLATFFIGLLIHFYKISNNLLNHDSVLNYYSDQNMIISGRWFLSVACSFSTWFDLPWVTGLFTMFFIALTAVVVVDVLKIKNLKLACLSGAVLVSFPAVTETLFFGFTSDGYALAMLLSSVSVWFAVRKSGKPWLNIIISVVCLTLSIGIYQAYLSFALVLLICYAIKNIDSSSENYIDKKLKFVGKHIAITGVSMALYYVIWKVLMLIQNVTPTDYQGINEVGFNLNTVITAPIRTIKSLALLILERNIFKDGISLYSILNIALIFAGGLLFCLYCYKIKIHKKKGDLLFLACCVISIPFVIYCWYFTSEGVVYVDRMLESASLCIVLILTLVDMQNIKKIIKNISVTIIALIVFNNFLMANICYFFLQQENDATISIATEMLVRIHDNEKGNSGKIFISGYRWINNEIIDKYNIMPIRCISTRLTYMLRKDLLLSEDTTISYLNNSLNCNFNKVDENEKEKIVATDEFKNMPIWPLKDSVKVINDVIVIKYSDEIDE